MSLFYTKKELLPDSKTRTVYAALLSLHQLSNKILFIV